MSETQPSRMATPSPELLEQLRVLVEFLNGAAPAPPSGFEPLLAVLSQHLGESVEDLSVVEEAVPMHRWADVDLAVADLAASDPDSRVIGIRGTEYQRHVTLSDLIAMPSQQAQFGVGPVDYTNLAIGPEQERAVVALGLTLTRMDGRPVVIGQRIQDPSRGRDRSMLEVISADTELTATVLKWLRVRSLELSVLRGQVISFNPSQYSDISVGVSFQHRPQLSADQVVLPARTLAQIEQHVLGVAQHRDRLLAAGQHLKRGILLYGPPGTGKTHTVRYLVGAASGTTVILLSGHTFALVRDAAVIARAHEPSIIVLEDVDLIAQDRGYGEADSLLFELLDVMDGLDGDADVTFLLTTNRVDVLERALSQRPGRVDLAAEIGLPDQPGRVRLLHLYAGSLPFSQAALADAAQRTQGTTASFAKELIRRAVLLAAGRDQEPADADLTAALDELLADGSVLTRSLLGVVSEGEPGD